MSLANDFTSYRPDLDPQTGPIPLPAEVDSFSHIPGEIGPPLVGHTLAFVRDPEKLTRTMRARHGRNFKIRLFGYPTLIVGDPDSVKAVLLDQERNFSSRWGWHHAIGELFARGLMLRDFDDHRLHRHIMQQAFRADAMSGYVDRMNPLIDKRLADWAELGPRVKFYEVIKQLTLDLAADVFIGVKLGPEADQLNRAFIDSVKASIALVKREVPGLAYARGMKGRRLLERFFAERVAKRREGDGSDMFSEFCRATSEDGETYADRDIVDHMIFLLMAAHDTTTSALTSMVLHVAQDQAIQDRLREEARGLEVPAITWQDRNKPVGVDYAFRETLRLHPPVPFIGRRTVRPFQLGDLELPASAAVSVCSLVTHRDPELWPEPERFDPERFSPERAEHKQHSHAWFPFGGGAHTCIGMHFAYAQVKAVMHQLLLSYRITLDGDPKPLRAIPIPHPTDGLPIRLEKL